MCTHKHLPKKKKKEKNEEGEKKPYNMRNVCTSICHHFNKTFTKVGRNAWIPSVLILFPIASTKRKGFPIRNIDNSLTQTECERH